MTKEPVHCLLAEHEAFLLPHTRLLLKSYQHWTGRSLLPGPHDPAGPVEALFMAPPVIVSHDTQDDPIFNYGNQGALNLFAMNWEQFTSTPSRVSAEPVNRAARQQMLEDVSRHGYTDQYQGIRITAAGRRFHIPRATVWNLVDDEGVYHGQAATFTQWVFL